MISQSFVPLDPLNPQDYDGERPVSEEAWDIIMGNNPVEKAAQAIYENQVDSPINRSTPQALYNVPMADNVPDISNVQVPSSFFSEQEKPVAKQTISKKSVMITEEELKVLVAAKQIISRLLEMTNCGTIGVNMASKPKVKMNVPKKVETKEARLKPKLKFEKKKKTLMEILRNDK